jgi:hypothetical protein
LIRLCKGLLHHHLLHPFLPSSKPASFPFSDQAENRKSSGQIAEILQLHITVNPECAKSRQFHILFSQRKHSGILNK